MRRSEDGFTLIEVLVAMGLVAIVLTAALPAFIGLMNSTVSARKDTRAKNLAQERVEEMRDLRFHIDRQNGPFLDLLDIYYTNAFSSGTTTTLTVGGTQLTGAYVASGAAANGEPAAPFYRVNTGPISGATNYTQTIDAQFLSPTGAVIPASMFQDVYDSQTSGKDRPPALLVGITVITRWSDAGRAKTLRTYTRMTDSRADAPLVQTQGRAIAIDISSSAADGTTLELQGGVASADGSQSTGSTVAGYATGALALRSGLSSVNALLSQFNLPSQPVSSTGSWSPQSGGGGCSWYGFGRSGVNDVTGDVSSGLPNAPADVGSGATPNTLSGYIQDNSGGSCGLMSYDNLAGGGSGRGAADPVGYEMGSAPYVSVPDTAGGSGAAISGATYVSSNALTSVPQKSISGASAALVRKAVLFPNNPESGGRGLVSITMSSASVACGSDGTVVGKYNLALGWWGKGTADASARWHTATWSYDSSVGASPVLANGSDTWDPTNTVLGNGLTLSQLVTSSFTGAPNVVNTGSTTGLRGFSDGVASFTTASTLTNEAAPGYSAITIKVGRVTCVADDVR